MAAGLGDTATPTASTSTRASTVADSSDSQLLAKVAAAVQPSVVSVLVTLPNGTEEGSGVVLSANGNILTNAHVVADAGNGSITVTFSDGTTAKARVVGADTSKDIAVIKAEGVSGLNAGDSRVQLDAARGRHGVGHRQPARSGRKCHVRHRVGAAP